MNRRDVLLSTTSAALAAMTGEAFIAGKPSLQAAESSSQPDESFGVRTFSGVGKEQEILEAGKEVEIFQQAGTGCLTHMWFAMDIRTRIRVYVDGETTPSIDMAQDLGHGFVHSGPPVPWGIPQFGRQGGVYNTYRIPFGSGVRVTVLPTTTVFDSDIHRNAWWIIRGSEGVPVTIGGVRLPPTARLKLHRLEGYQAKPLEEFAIASPTRAGALYQVTLSARGEQPLGTWEDQSFEEGCVRAYFGVSKEPTFLSSGLEDYFVSAGYFYHEKLFQTELSGLTYIDRGKNAFVAYRFHDRDPVFFQNGMRLTLRCGEEIDGKVFHHPPSATYTAYTWVYEW